MIEVKSLRRTNVSHVPRINLLRTPVSYGSGKITRVVRQPQSEQFIKVTCDDVHYLIEKMDKILLLQQRRYIGSKGAVSMRSGVINNDTCKQN